MNLITYADHGAIQTLYRGDSVVESWTYNNPLQPVSISAAVGTTTRLALGLSYCPGTMPCSTNNGNLQWQSITFPSRTVNGTQINGLNVTQNYSYDWLSRLLTFTETGNFSNQAYNYDAYGNRWVTGTGWIPYTGLTPTSNQFTGNRWTGSGISYDGSGNQKQVMPSQSFTYDSENRITTATMGTVTTTYAYDGDGRRVQKTISPASGPAVTTTYVYDAAGNTVAEYGGPTPTVSGTTYLTQDHLGSTRLVTDSSGTPLKRYDYAPFGEDLISGIDGRNSEYPTGTYPTAAVDALNQKFTSKERDAETGLDYFGARYMSSAQGRFTSADPTFLNILKVTNPQRWNLYSYGLNNPLRYVDPDGEEAIAINYPGYQVGVRGNFTLPLGHAGVVMVAQDGSTHYFEYGRYAPAGAGGDVAQGIVRNAGPTDSPTPSVQRDASGNITPDSMKGLLQSLSDSSGKHGSVEAIVLNTTGAQDMVMEAYLEAREAQNSDPNRQHYSLFGGHNCGTLICDALHAAGRPAPAGGGRTPGEVFGSFGIVPKYFGVLQQFTFEPQKAEVKSKICYANDQGKQVCQ